MNYRYKSEQSCSLSFTILGVCLCFCQNFCFEKFFYRVGAYGEKCVANGNTNTLLAFAEAERARNFNLIFQIIFCDQGTDTLNDLARTLEMAGTSDTYSNSDFHKKQYPFVLFENM